MVQFTLTPQDMSVVDDTGAYKALKGKVAISIGGGQPDEKMKTTSNVAKTTVTIN